MKRLALLLVLFCALSAPAQDAINWWSGYVPFAFKIVSLNTVDHYDFSLIFGVPKHTSGHWLLFDDPGCYTGKKSCLPALTPLCQRCFMLAEDKRGELWFGIWSDGGGSPASYCQNGPCAFVGRVLGDALTEEDEVTGEGLLIRRVHGTILGTLVIAGKECHGVQAFFSDSTNANPGNENSAGAGSLDVRVFHGECQ